MADTVATACRSLGGQIQNNDGESTVHQYHSTVLAGALRKAVRSLTGRSGGRVLGFEDTDAKTGEKVINVLWKKSSRYDDPKAGGGGMGII